MGTISVSLPSDGQTIDAADVNSPINTIVAVINGNLDNDNIASGANISGTKLASASTPLSVLDATSRGGWIAGVLAAPNTITYNGNRSYDLVFNSTDYTDELSPGMRLRATRTVTAPTQCADLESGSSQYFSKTTPAGVTFTDDFTCMGWVKLESYTQGGIIARRNADTEGWCLFVEATGQLSMTSLRIASNNRTITSSQSLPLNKWIHIAATMDNSANSHTMYIDGVSVPFATTTNGTITALVQGTTALVVGARKSDGTDPFDGKIAQAAVFSSVLSAATIRSYMSQGLSGAESTMVAGYSLSNSLLDLTSNDNDLSANGGALATDTDSPFAQGSSATGGYTAGTTEFGIVTKVAFSTNTTVTVQVPEGGAIPTSGGVSAVAYSVQKAPLGFPAGADKWYLITISPTNRSVTSATYATATDNLTVPIGSWILSLKIAGSLANTSGATRRANVTLSSTTTTETHAETTAHFASNSTTTSYDGVHRTETIVSVESATTFTMLANLSSTSSATFSVAGSSDTPTVIKAVCALL